MLRGQGTAQGLGYRGVTQALSPFFPLFPPLLLDTAPWQEGASLPRASWMP